MTRTSTGLSRGVAKAGFSPRPSANWPIVGCAWRVWEAKAADEVIRFGKCAPTEWQATVALTGIEKLIDGRFDLIANQLGLLDEWLTELRNAGAIVGDVKNQYLRIVDGLAAAGDRAAVRLRQLDQ